MFAQAAKSPEPTIRSPASGRTRGRGRLWLSCSARGSTRPLSADDVDATTLGWLVLSQIHARQFRRAHSETSPTMERALLKALLAALLPPDS
jgi:hypothetical protein